MKTMKFTPREMLEAIRATGWDKVVGMTIKTIKEKPDTFLDEPIEVRVPETVEEFDQLASQ